MKRLTLGLLLATMVVSPAFARDNLQITGSSTVYPFSVLASENFSGTGFPSPVVETVGSGAGIKSFCSGIGEDTADIVNSSRKMKKEELASCEASGVKNPLELTIGYDGIVFATDVKGPSFQFTNAELRNAIAAQVLVDGKLVANPYTNWNQINPAFPDWKIDAYIPGEKHGTREVFEQKVLAAGCDKDGLKAAGVVDDEVAKTCVAVRKDGLVSDIDGDYSETMARLQSNPTALGVFGISFYIENGDKIQVASVEGVTPSLETIASGEYPVSRPLFVYVKREHIGVIPGVKEFLTELLSDAAAGQEGYLIDIGLIPLPTEELINVQSQVSGL